MNTAFAGVAALATCGPLAAQTQVVEVRKYYIDRPPGTIAIIESVTVPADTIQLHRDLNFENPPILLNVSATPAGQAQDLPAGAKDTISSLRWTLPPGVLVVLYEDAGAKGEQMALWGSGQIDTLSTFDFNDKATQWAWYYVGGATEPTEVIVRGAALPVGSVIVAAPVPDATMQLFKSKNFEANTVTVNPLTAPANALQTLPEDLPDSLTSMRWNLPPGVVVVFHQDADGSKQQVPIWGSGQVTDLDIWDFNDKASRWAWHYIGSPLVESLGDATPVIVTEKPAVVVVDRDAIDLVSKAMVPTELKVEANDLLAKKNPVGDGTFVYAPKTTYEGVERHVIWLVLDNRAYALTGPAKLLTPTLTSAAEATDAAFAHSGVNRLHAEDDAVKIVFKDQ